MIKHCSFVCAAAKAGPGPIGRSRHLFLVALPALSRAAVMPAMGTKSREVIWGGQIMGAKIRAKGAREAATRVADNQSRFTRKRPVNKVRALVELRIGERP